MGYQLLDKPLTEAEITENDCSIDVVVDVAYSTLIDNTYDGLLDILEEATIETGVLSDVEDTIVGCDALNQTVHIRVVADVDLFE